MILLIYIIGFIAHYILTLSMIAWINKFNPEHFEKNGVDILSTGWATQMLIDGLLWPLSWGIFLICKITQL